MGWAELAHGLHRPDSRICDLIIYGLGRAGPFM